MSNRITFESLTEDEIDQVEQNVREAGLNLADNSLLHEDQLIDYFGKSYASNPSNFHFEIGDRKLIRIVRDHLITQKHEKGTKFMRRFRKKNDQKNPKRIKLDQFTDALKNEHDENVMTDETYDIDGVYSQELSVDLLNRVKTYMQTFEIASSIIEQITLKMVSVKIVEGVVVAEVFCAVCQHDQSKKRKLTGKRVFYKGGDGSKYWVLSNFGQHLKNVHKLNSRSNSDENDSLPIDATEIHSSVAIKNEVVSSQSNDDKLAMAHNFSIEYVVNDSASDQATNSNSVSAIFDQITTQVTKMVGATLSHNDETEQMRYQFGEHESNLLTVTKIHRDGSCLFGSLAHQLFANKVNSSVHAKATKRLRKDVVDYISHQYESFKFELQGRVYEEINAEAIHDLDRECKAILNNLREDQYWGGSETLKAVQQMHHVNILIFNEQGSCSFFNQFSEENTRTITLAFRFTNGSNEFDHYDSVCDISSNEILNAMSYLSKPKADMIFDQTL